MKGKIYTLTVLDLWFSCLDTGTRYERIMHLLFAEATVSDQWPPLHFASCLFREEIFSSTYFSRATSLSLGVSDCLSGPSSGLKKTREYTNLERLKLHICTASDSSQYVAVSVELAGAWHQSNRVYEAPQRFSFSNYPQNNVFNHCVTPQYTPQHPHFMVMQGIRNGINLPSVKKSPQYVSATCPDKYNDGVLDGPGLGRS